MSEEDRLLRTIKHTIPFDVLNDVLTRFIILVPEAAKENLIRICFQIELAHWFYLDFYVGNDDRCKTCSIYEFAAHVFQHIPSLKSEIPRLGEILCEWREYKQNVPTYGAIILSEGLTHVLLVQSYWAKASWGFPKGKVNEDEDPAHCAIREVYEETGFDITAYLNQDEYFESVINDQLARLYIIKNVPKSTEFKPRTRCEIKACSWFAISDLPNNKKDSTPKVKMGVSSNSFFMVLPFIKRIKNICSGQSSATRRNRQKSTSDVDTVGKGKTKAKNDIDEVKSVKKRERRHSKRQLFTEDDNRIVEFTAPSWLNFKFNRMAILECLR
ncbi:m7GpppN-mRNA hydrolase [Euwallacea similis]|uniref:m7GpppN-mRNA hydrolase n=1 Tax=Euwallacea similis TaxID=1736056 RepID=UPI00344BEF62